MDAAVVIYEEIPVAGLTGAVSGAIRVRGNRLGLDVEHEIARRRQALEAVDDRNLAAAQDAGPRPADAAGEEGRVWAGPSFTAVLRNRLVPDGALQVLAQVANQGAVIQFDVGPFVEPQLWVGADVDSRPPLCLAAISNLVLPAPVHLGPTVMAEEHQRLPATLHYHRRTQVGDDRLLFTAALPLGNDSYLYSSPV